jgi:carbon-monoxide dehydrogenase medium subunit
VRRLPPFEYHDPTSVEEAVALLRHYGERASVLAGGTDLLVSLRRPTRRPAAVIDIKGIAALRRFQVDDGAGLAVGAAVTVETVRTSAAVEARWPLVAAGAAAIGHPAIRHRATVVGNLCNAAPSADLAPPLLALGARLRVAGAAGERVVPLDEFFVGPFRTRLAPDELVTGVEIPPLGPAAGGVYLWLPKRVAVDETLVGVAAVVRLDDGRFRQVRLALGSVGPTPLRAWRAEQVLEGEGVGDAVIEEAGRVAAGEAMPRRRADYRRDMCQYLVRRALHQAVRLARAGSR